MRADGRKYDLGKRFAILIGVAATGVMALGAQTGAAGPDVVSYDTKLRLTTDRGNLYHGLVLSDRDRYPRYHPAKKVVKCMEGREVILFKKRPGTDRILGTFQSEFSRRNQAGGWGMLRGPWNEALVYAKVTPKVGDGFVCRADYAR